MHLYDYAFIAQKWASLGTTLHVHIEWSIPPHEGTPELVQRMNDLKNLPGKHV